MSRKEDKRKTVLPINETKAIQAGSTSLTPVNLEDLLRMYKEEMRASGTHKDVLIWQLIIIDNFIKNFLAEHNMAIMTFTQTDR